MIGISPYFAHLWLAQTAFTEVYLRVNTPQTRCEPAHLVHGYNWYYFHSYMYIVKSLLTN